MKGLSSFFLLQAGQARKGKHRLSALSALGTSDQKVVSLALEQQLALEPFVSSSVKQFVC